MDTIQQDYANAGAGKGLFHWPGDLYIQTFPISI